MGVLADIVSGVRRWLLLKAVRDGSPERVGALLSEGTDRSIEGDGGTSILAAAVEGGRVDVVELLVASGVSEEAASQALLMAVERGDRSMAQALLRACADPQSSDNALIAAAGHGRTEIVDLLISRGAGVNATDVHGWTPLMMACAAGHLETAQRLIANGALVNVADKCGYTSLICASQMGWKDTVELLIEHGADVNSQATSSPVNKSIYGVPENWHPQGMTALAWAAVNGDPEIVELLLRSGAQIDVRDACGWTPLMWAAWCGRTRVLELLLEAKADPGSTTLEMRAGLFPRGSTALMMACRRGDSQAVRTLVQNAANVKTRNNFGETALIEAVKERIAPSSQLGDSAEEIVRILLDNGAEVDSANREGVTPLMTAARHNRQGVVRILIDRGADVNARSLDGVTALGIAIVDDRQPVADMLRAAGAREPMKEMLPAPASRARLPGIVSRHVGFVPVTLVLVALVAYAALRTIWRAADWDFVFVAEKSIFGPLFGSVISFFPWILQSPERFLCAAGWAAGLFLFGAFVFVRITRLTTHMGRPVTGLWFSVIRVVCFAAMVSIGALIIAMIGLFSRGMAEETTTGLQFCMKISAVLVLQALFLAFATTVSKGGGWARLAWLALGQLAVGATMLLVAFLPWGEWLI